MKRYVGAKRSMLFGLLTLGLSACTPDLSGLLVGPTPALYELNAIKKLDAQEGWPIDAQISVEAPLAANAYDTTRIVIHVEGNELQYLGGARWMDRAPRMVQQLMVEGIEDSGMFNGVARQSVGVRADYVVHGELREFGAFVDGADTPRGEVVLTVNLIWPGNAEIVAHKTFRDTAEAGGKSGPDLVKAIDKAQKKVIKSAILWIGDQVTADVGARR